VVEIQKRRKVMNKKGFTLIEVLIVVVIIAVLASLLLPRMAAQTERAIAAEGLQTLGVIRRAQEQRAELNGSTNWTTASDHTAIQTSLNVEIKNGSKFNYTCSATSCVARRVGNTSKAITFYRNGSVSCAGYTAVKSENKTVGCA